MPLSVDIDSTSSRPGNQVSQALRTSRLVRGFSAFLSGVLLSAAFPPLEWSWLAWIALVPLLVLGLSPCSSPWWIGYWYGLGHFLTTFAWLRKVFLPAPLALALACALFPALWLFLARLIHCNISVAEDDDLLPRTDPGLNPSTLLNGKRQCLFLLLLAFMWCAFEWVRSWLLSGLPWNLLGVSQWRNSALLPLSRLTGVYGLSFLIVSGNIAFYFVAVRIADRMKGILGPRMTWPLVLFVGLVTVAVAMGRVYRISVPSDFVRVAAIQGNIPQSRFASASRLDFALEVYTKMTRRIVNLGKPDLVVWPETAIPESLRTHAPTAAAMVALFDEIRTPMIVGTIDYRYSPRADSNEPPRGFNSALMYDGAGNVVDWYDKVRLVPFGEFVPLEQYFPWLTRWIGMGRSLSPGRAATVLTFDGDRRFGVCICYEDIFPEITRQHVFAGANILLAITNDAWFGETSGSRQHLAHSVFRAVESCRPMLRNGNNSDTCLILPDGKILAILYDARGGRFVRDARVYTVPVWQDLPVTFYTRHGNWFPVFGAVATLIAVLWCFFRYVSRKRRLYNLIHAPAPSE